MNKWDLLNTIFTAVFTDIRGELQALRTEHDEQRAMLTTILTNQEAIKQQMADANQALKDTKAALEANNAIITEISGDVAELKDSNTALAVKVDELLAKIPDEVLVQEIKALVDGQSANLATIAAVVPEPEPEPTPGPEPTPE